jgi:DUF917 family protein
MRYVTEHDLDDIALGAAILGTGGGGDPRLGLLMARAALRRHGPVPVVDLDELDESALVVPVAMIGAPTVANEKLPSVDPVGDMLDAVAGRLNATATHTMPVEIGGIAALLPIVAAAQRGVPLVDADMMGRAFPELQMVIPSVLGRSAGPVCLADEWGNLVVVEGADNRHAERLARAVCVAMGANALIALYAVTGADARDLTVPGTLTRAQRLGAAVRAARTRHEDPVEAVVDLVDGHRLFAGKVVDLARRTDGGFTHLEVDVSGTGTDSGRTLRVVSQNEHLVARCGADVLATTPDLIIVLQADTAEPVTTEGLRYGMRVQVIAAPCDARYRTEEGLRTVGPEAFGHDLAYVPVEELAERRRTAGRPA